MRAGLESEIRVWTIGHGTESFADLEQRIAGYGISMLVDVRSQPYSRHAPDFTRRKLEELTGQAGIGYRWLGSTLGGKPGDGGPVGSERPGFDETIDELVELAGVSTTVILCAELDPSGCHRATFVAAALHERGVEVHHILEDGSTRRHETTLPFS